MFKFTVIVVKVLFLSSASAADAGNTISAGECGKIFTEDRVILESPGYPSGYPPNQRCSYVFQGPSACPTHYNFQLMDFNLASSEGCVDDRLEIHERDALCGTKSGLRTYSTENGLLQARFLSDAQGSGRGFKILVTRLPCGVKPETTTADAGVAWEMTPVTVASAAASPRSAALPPQGLPFCCARSYSSKRFFLSSPGFPYGGDPGECVYHVYRANADVCRLRIHFLYFWSGEQDPGMHGCTGGFLQIDGKFVCGCRIGLKLISPFDWRWGSAPKVFRFKSAGGPSGFVLEIVQDECPKRLGPTNSTSTGAERPPFYYYHDQINGVSWPGSGGGANNNNNNQENVVERALLVKENTEILDDNDAGGGGVVRSVYFFEAPEDYDYYDVRSGSAGGKRTREVEETTYTDTSFIKSFLPDGYDNYRCRAWGGLQWAMLAKEVLWQQMPRCSVTNKPNARQCEDASYVKGYVQSPGYPNYYPGNVNLCYRFRTQPGFCGIRLAFADFDIQSSFECRRDYLLLGGRYRYCGRSLYRSVLTFDLSSKPHEDISFITDGHYCGRGFKGTYEQIPCNNVGPPVTPPNPVYPTRPTIPYPPLTPPSPNPDLPCGKDIQDDFFALEVYGHNRPRCVFNIFKRNPGVCRLSLAFLDFNLPCGSEQLLINNRRYCGQISGQTLNVNFNQFMVAITYERSSASPAITGLRFRINGRQSSTGCDPYEFPSVPAERLHFTSNYTDYGRSSKGNTIKPSSEAANNLQADNNGTFSERKIDDDTCGLILNATEQAIASSICSSLVTRNNNVECIPITAKVAYVPYNSTTGSDLYSSVINEVTAKSFDGNNVEELGVNEISCEDIDRIISNK